jgi:hypothetical protein
MDLLNSDDNKGGIVFLRPLRGEEGALFSNDLKGLLLRVITSWQVIAVTAVLILYLLLVFYVARLQRVKRPARFSSTGRKKKPSKAEIPGPDKGDDLGLEE